MTDAIDTGFGAVLAGEVYAHPEPETFTVTVKPEEPPCDSSIEPAPEPASPSIEPPSETSAGGSTTSAPPSTPAVPAATSASGLSPAGVQAAKALVNLPPLSWPELSKLAMEVAMNIKQMSVILSENKLSQTQYDFLETHNEFYRNALAAACAQWHAPLSVQERLKMEAAAILEDSLLGIGARMQNRAEGLPGVIEAAKLFAKVAGVGEPTGGQVSSSERFVINIDLGGDQKISVGVATAPAQGVDDIPPRALPANGDPS